MENLGAPTRTLHFSVQGSLINRMAREAVFYTNPPRIKWAIDLVMSCLVTDKLSEGDRLALAIKIIEGDADIVGCYPGDDYGVDVHDEPENAGKLWEHLERKYVELQEIKTENLRLKQMLGFVGEDLPEHTKRMLNRTWRTEMCDRGKEEDIFPGVGPECVQWPAERTATPAETNMVEDYLERMRRPDSDQDYGWLSPTGEFHPVDFAEHSSWAWEYVRKQIPDVKDRLREFGIGIDTAGEYLQSRGWVLLHNPGMGTAFVSAGPAQKLTKAQREFLYDYYQKRGKKGMADKYFQEDDD